MAWRSRRGIAALAIPATLAFPAAASAGVWGPVYYQIVYVGGAPERLSSQQQQSLAQIKADVMRLQHSNLTADQIQGQAAGLASQAVAVLQATPNTAPAITPALASFASPGQLTQNSNPVVDLFIKLQHPTH